MNKKNLIYKGFIIMSLLVSLTLSNFSKVFASGSISVSASATKITLGESVTIYISGNGSSIMPMSVTTDNGSVSSQPNNGVADGESKTAVVVPSRAGTANITVSGKVADTDNPIEARNFSQTITINVSDGSSSNVGGGGQYMPPAGNNTTNNNTTQNDTKTTNETKSTNNNLSSLSVSMGTLNPVFDANVTDYTVELDYTVTTIDIAAELADAKATITGGIGTHELNEGENILTVEVSAEDGSVKNYNINVKVAEAPKTTLKFNNEEYSVVSKYTDLKLPDAFTETKIKVNNVEVKALTSDTYKITLLYLSKNEDKKLYIYDEKTQQVLGEYKAISFNNQTYVVYPISEELKNQKNMTFGSIVLDDLTIDGWNYNDASMSDFRLLYLVNNRGNKDFYRYDTIEKSLQRLVMDVENKINTQESNNTWLFVGGAIVILLIASAGGYFFYQDYKKKKFSQRKKLHSLDDNLDDE